ncbi:hypothetical protein GFB56_09905 [Ensifer sp. T173]|uniref:Uncharacterized protein n=1 Tax=Ensifer canadensis TaxID=555315 RepID=A0AAW4FMF0_9HYPH|nr:hypothetical protein [Ensifer canadensis]MBM3091130.1 hypothetical protein [Ensifer canadensis]UBI75816.1 hypothetical protein J3R84_01250 [Ensifer canadensis]
MTYGYQWRQVQSEDIRRRLHVGKEIDLADALILFDIRRLSGLSPLAELRASGRINGPLEPYSEIPEEAWHHLRWETDGVDFLAVTPEGKRVYDLRFATREAIPTNRELLDQGPATSSVELVQPVHLQQPSDVFRRIVEADRSETSPWTIEDYNTELAKGGLSVTRDKQRVSGVRIADQGRIERGGGPINLHKALMISRFRLVEPLGHFREIPTRRGVAQALYRWLAVDHANLTAARRAVSESAIDDLADDLRKSFGAAADAQDVCLNSMRSRPGQE